MVARDRRRAARRGAGRERRRRTAPRREVVPAADLPRPPRNRRCASGDGRSASAAPRALARWSGPGRPQRTRIRSGDVRSRALHGVLGELAQFAPRAAQRGVSDLSPALRAHGLERGQRGDLDRPPDRRDQRDLRLGLDRGCGGDRGSRSPADRGPRAVDPGGRDRGRGRNRDADARRAPPGARRPLDPRIDRRGGRGPRSGRGSCGRPGHSAPRRHGARSRPPRVLLAARGAPRPRGALDPHGSPRQPRFAGNARAASGRGGRGPARRPPRTGSSVRQGPRSASRSPTMPGSVSAPLVLSRGLAGSLVALALA